MSLGLSTTVRNPSTCRRALVRSFSNSLRPTARQLGLGLGQDSEQQRRSYALSRFPERNPGASRSTQRHTTTPLRPLLPVPPQSVAVDPQQLEQQDRSSASESPLWREASRRAPANDPVRSLRKLLLQNETLVVTRELEMLNIFMGFEQANRYAIHNEVGEPLGYIAEEPRGFLSIFSRQLFRTHRPFRAVVMDTEGSPILWVRRPFAWVNSRMFVQKLNESRDYTEDGEPVLDTFAEVQQRWHPWRRRYDLFLRDVPQRILSLASEVQPEPTLDSFIQLAKIDEGILAWHFKLFDRRGEEMATVKRAFRGFGREIFTDTGQYFIRFESDPPDSDLIRSPSVIRNLSLEERALVLATAVNIDFDYFSRHSGGHGMGLGLWGGGWDSE